MRYSASENTRHIVRMYIPSYYISICHNYISIAFKTYCNPYKKKNDTMINSTLLKRTQLFFYYNVQINLHIIHTISSCEEHNDVNQQGHIVFKDNNLNIFFLLNKRCSKMNDLILTPFWNMKLKPNLIIYMAFGGNTQFDITDT